MARPMPPAAPVTKATLPERSAFMAASAGAGRGHHRFRILCYYNRPPPCHRNSLAMSALDRQPRLPPAARQLLRDDGPLYRQLAAILRAPIVDGTYPVGDRAAQGSRDRRSLRHQPDHRPPGAARARSRRAHPQTRRQAGGGRGANAGAEAQLRLPQLRRHRRLHQRTPGSRSRAIGARPPSGRGPPST